MAMEGTRPAQGNRWLFLVVQLGFLALLVGAIRTDIAERTATRMSTWGLPYERALDVGYVDLLATLARLLLFTWGLILIVAIARRDERVPSRAAAYGLVFLLVEAGARAAEFLTWTRPRGLATFPFSPTEIVVGLAVVAWIAFVAFSPRVRALFDRAVGPLPDAARILLGILGVGLAAAPQILDLALPPYHSLAGLISPGQSNEAGGFASGIYLAVWGVGVYLVLKPAAGLRTRWVVLLLPLGLLLVFAFYFVANFRIGHG